MKRVTADCSGRRYMAPREAGADERAATEPRLPALEALVTAVWTRRLVRSNVNGTGPEHNSVRAETWLKKKRSAGEFTFISDFIDCNKNVFN